MGILIKMIVICEQEKSTETSNITKNIFILCKVFKKKSFKSLKYQNRR